MTDVRERLLEAERQRIATLISDRIDQVEQAFDGRSAEAQLAKSRYVEALAEAIDIVVGADPQSARFGTEEYFDPHYPAPIGGGVVEYDFAGHDGFVTGGIRTEFSGVPKIGRSPFPVQQMPDAFRPVDTVELPLTYNSGDVREETSREQESAEQSFRALTRRVMNARYASMERACVEAVALNCGVSVDSLGQAKADPEVPYGQIHEQMFDTRSVIDFGLQRE